MLLSEEQVRTYEQEGYVFLTNCYTSCEIDVLKAESLKVFAEDTPKRVLEKEHGIVRSVYGSHTTNEVFNKLSRHPRIVEPVQQLLGSEVYVYQFKLNAKAAFGGDLWEWHQDYIFWQKEDGLRSDRAASVAIFLDDVNEFNGPMFVIPGSQAEGVIDKSAQPLTDVMRYQVYENSPAWISNLTADLKYSLDRETIAYLVEKYGLFAPKGPAGSALFFHGNLVHASSNNISPFDRTVVIVTFNSVENVPDWREQPRPDFLASRDVAPIVPVLDDALMRR
jgi:Phytanoyl-CoA dioxygenase (PhyH)